ncbi:DUF2306 domain-containing protein [uncultured Sphingomonas sp.]|uniref:DUF2306 domain-containing protein n=1 Tax=uncultured Sphingomonas sp. TaxID=158754 RepID=UPI0025F0547F|nr:DUF2306 domain-containing protein [uncultured Sphingomonas sp.]
MTSLPLAAPSARHSDLSPLLRAAILAGGGTLSVMALVALAKGALGLSPTLARAHGVAVAIHLAAVLPALPLGLYVLFARKGDARHRMLGKLWAVLMVVGALSALALRDLNHGQFSPIHIFVPVTLIGLWRAIAAARAGRIAAHRRIMVLLYLAGLIGAGAFAFAPGRVMGTWLFG